MARTTILAKDTTGATSTSFTVAFDPVTVGVLVTDSEVDAKDSYRMTIYQESGDSPNSVGSLRNDQRAVTVWAPGVYHVVRHEGTSVSIGVYTETA